MTTAFTTSATVERPAPEVWARLTDWPAAPAWMSGVDSIRVAGNELTFRARGRDRTGRIEVVEPGRTVVVRSAQGGVTAAYTYTCEPEGDRTRVTLTADCRVTGPWRPFAGLLRAAIRRADGGQPAAFKRVVEGR
ncbi:SRPBCC family protein [Paractinoplanes brasiliensis]|uniref:Carbon monoxide dehydrogenase subunit G n=1 Tax=Paractinoplanes brasiliensis TaxID=52695 RepID=A0A4R6JPI2_9ACTN|nr:SRPBCC family protein [Actinoplanes brasiliensis]TDO38340.1 carbon monoxide dehydrogenase subunit G [Actinoplanes brasiliensis]